MAVPKNRQYLQWKENLIKLILEDKSVNSVIQVQEIRCVVNSDGSFIDSYLDGDTPEEAWYSEVQAMRDSQ